MYLARRRKFDCYHAVSSWSTILQGFTGSWGGYRDSVVGHGFLCNWRSGGRRGSSTPEDALCLPNCHEGRQSRHSAPNPNSRGRLGIRIASWRPPSPSTTTSPLPSLSLGTRRPRGPRARGGGTCQTIAANNAPRP